MAKKIAKKEAPKKVSAKKVEKKAAKKPEHKKVEKKAVKVDKKSEKKGSKKPEPKKIEKKDLKGHAKKHIPHKTSKKEEKKPAKIEAKKKPEPKLDKKALAKAKEQEKKALAKAKEQEKKQKAKEAEEAKEAEKRRKEQEKIAAKEAQRLQKEKEQEEKKAAKKGAKGAQEEEASKKPGRPAKEAASEDDIVGSDDGDWEEEEIIDIEEIETEKRNFSIDDELKDNLVADILSRADGDLLKDIFTKIREPKFFSAGVDECIERNCDNPATTSNFCRLHYIKNWNDIKKKEQILTDGTLQELIEVLVSKYPVKYIEAILQDLSDDKIFHSVLKELNIESVEESFDDELEDADDDSDIAFETKTTFKGLGEEE